MQTLFLQTIWDLKPNTWDFNPFWFSIFQLGIVGALILIGNTLRRKTPFLRNYLLPTGLIAGFLGLGLKYLFQVLKLDIGGTAIISESYMHFLTYHSLAIGFIALGLVTVEKKVEKEGRALKSGALIVGTYLIQGLVGLVISVIVGLIFANMAIGKAPYAGVLLPLGFGQGPGQAGNMGGVYEILETDNALVGGRDFGLSVAAMGFIVASIIGTIILNVVARKGLVKRYDTEATETFGGLAESVVDHPDEIPVVESVDKFTIQTAFVLAIYLITFGLMALVSFLVINLAGVASLRGIIWGFNFLFAILTTMIVKAVLNLLRKKKIMKRKYINNFMQNRIAGLAFDTMISTAIISINFGKLNDISFWILLALMSIFGSIVTFFYIDGMAKRYFHRTRWYTFFAFFGMLTGTMSEGIALVREIDPYFETGVAEDLVNGSGTAAIFGVPMLLITAIVYRGWVGLVVSIALCAVLFVGMTLLLHFFTKAREKKIAAEITQAEEIVETE
ncbi:MAG: hypothetical protein BWY30_00477 [Tenericutes bacterium ADurb.Bin239]|nr:MAG: hypothetical protein BWY30_00477 [Tenericutes bacterium ADurb.Bin239]